MESDVATQSTLPLQLFLAKQLPEELEINAAGYIEWITGGHPNSREWDYIVRRVEEKLTGIQWFHYLRELSALLKVPGSHEIQIKNYILASWETRAVVLMKVIGETND